MYSNRHEGWEGVVAHCGFGGMFGCVTGAELAQQRAAREYQCPIERTKARWISAAPDGYQIYQVRACGRVATYACNEFNKACVRESDDRPE